MIHFSPGARIHFFTLDLFTLLLNTAQWSTQADMAVEVSSILQAGTNNRPAGDLVLEVDLVPQVNVASARLSLQAYLVKFLPPGFGVERNEDRVCVLKAFAQPRAARKEA
jgi:hypothetical protein